MFQIGLFGFPIDTGETHWWVKIFRDLFLAFDTAIYTVITWLYQIVFFLADTTIFKREFIIGFFHRFQVLLGVFMIFKLAISVLQVVMNPDLLNDKKRGAGQIITRVLIMLAMITAIIPLNIPKSVATEGSYEEYLRDNGLLFGILYSFQSRILRNNTIGKLIMDDTTMDQNTLDTMNTNIEEDRDSYLKVVEAGGNSFSLSILRGFLRPNLKSEDGDVNNYKDYMCPPDEEQYKKTLENIANNDADKNTNVLVNFAENYFSTLGEGLNPLNFTEKYKLITPLTYLIAGVRTYSDQEEIAEEATNFKLTNSYMAWLSSASAPSAMLEVGSLTCKADDGEERYAYSYLPIIPTVVGAFVILILIGYCLDIAIRTIKLEILRLLAPIAIISYVDPQSSQKGAFANWVKLTISTYVDLFIRLTILFLIATLASQIFASENIIGLKTNSVLEIISKIVLVIGVFYFARQAPKFIADALGVKSMGTGIGIAGVLGGVGAVMGGAGIRGFASGFMNASQDAADAAAQGKAAPPAYSTQRDRIAQLISGDKNRRGGLLGRWQAAANDRTNAGIAWNHFGMNRAVAKDAKDEMIRLKGEASAAEERYNRFKDGSMTAEERSRIESAANPAYAEFINNNMTDAERSSGYGSLSDDRRNDLMMQYLEYDLGQKQAASAKQDSWYKDISNVMEGTNQNETPYEKFRANRVGSRAQAALSDRAANINNPILSRVVGEAGRVVGTVAGGPGQRRANRLNRDHNNQRSMKYSDRNREAAASYEHRDSRYYNRRDRNTGRTSDADVVTNIRRDDLEI